MTGDLNDSDPIIMTEGTTSKTSNRPGVPRVRKASSIRMYSTQALPSSCTDLVVYSQPSYEEYFTYIQDTSYVHDPADMP
jgi:hypothetical protein